MLKYHIINLASCRLCPRRAAGGKERRYMDQNDKNKSNKNNDRRKGVLSLLIWALVLTIGFNLKYRTNRHAFVIGIDVANRISRRSRIITGTAAAE